MSVSHVAPTLPDSEAAARSLVRAAVLLTAAASVVVAALGLVLVVLLVSGRDAGAASVRTAFDAAAGVWGIIQAGALLLVASTFGLRAKAFAVTLLTASASLAFAIVSVLHAGGSTTDAAHGAAAAVLIGLFVLWLASAVPAGARAGVLGHGSRIIGSWIVALTLLALPIAVAAVLIPASVTATVFAITAAVLGLAAGVLTAVWWCVTGLGLFPSRIGAR